MLMKLMRLLPDQAYISLQYFKHFHCFPNLQNPKTFNEKLQWLKLHDRRDLYTTMVDKYLVKDYVSGLIGKEHIVPTLGVWDSAEKIDFESLPNQFVLKWNHDSGSVIICRDKKTFDQASAIEKLNQFKSHNGYWYAREWPYKNVNPKIIAETYLSDPEQADGLVDYKFYCFNGKPRFLYVSKGLEDHATATISFLTLDWQFAPYQRRDFSPFTELPPKPDQLNQMLAFAKELSAGHQFLRVDFYQVDERLYFSELTFYPCAGYMPFDNPAHDLELGEMLDLTHAEM